MDIKSQYSAAKLRASHAAEQLKFIEEALEEAQQNVDHLEGLKADGRFAVADVAARLERAKELLAKEQECLAAAQLLEEHARQVAGAARLAAGSQAMAERAPGGGVPARSVEEARRFAPREAAELLHSGFFERE